MQKEKDAKEIAGLADTIYLLNALCEKEHPETKSQPPDEPLKLINPNR